MNRWRLKEIIVMAVLSVVFGIVYLVFLPVGKLLVTFMGPIGYDLIFGIWFIVSIIAAYILRKPGAAFLSETIAATVEMMLGNAMGPIIIVTGMIQGLGAEAAFAITRYRRYSLWVLMLAGVGAAIFSFIWGYFRSGYAALSTPYIMSMLVIRMISGAIISGMLGKAISDSLAKTGVLSSFALGKQIRKERSVS